MGRYKLMVVLLQILSLIVVEYHITRSLKKDNLI